MWGCIKVEILWLFVDRSSNCISGQSNTEIEEYDMFRYITEDPLERLVIRIVKEERMFGAEDLDAFFKGSEAIR